MLNKRIRKNREERTKYFIKEKKQMEELYQFMNEAKQKIEIADSFKDKEDVRMRELNTRLLQKISYLEKGAVLGMIVCSCFFLAAILYFVKANVYVILISGLKKKVAHVRNKIKKKELRRIGGKGKNEITNKAYFKLIVLAFVGVGSIYTYRTYYVRSSCNHTIGN